MKKLLSLICSICLLAVAAFALSACGGEAIVKYKLSDDGTHFIVSGVTGRTSSLGSYEIPSEYSEEEGGELLPVTEIGEEAFMGCNALYSITLPDTIEKIGVRAFMNCGFRNFTIPESVKSIGYAAFGKCTSLTEITIPQSVTDLQPYAFAYCSNLETVVLKAEIEDLPPYTFANSYASVSGNLYTSTSLKNIYLSSSLKKINLYALDGNLFDDIYFAGSEETWNELYFYTYEKVEGSGNEYKEKKLEKSEVIRNGVTVHYNVEF